MNYIEIVNDAIQYIESNLHRKLCLEELASRYYISPMRVCLAGGSPIRPDSSSLMSNCLALISLGAPLGLFQAQVRQISKDSWFRVYPGC